MEIHFEAGLKSHVMLQSQPSYYQRQPLPLGVMHVSSQRGSSTGMRKTIPSLTPSLTIYP